MNRSLRMERVYRLSDYNSLRVVDELVDLPEEVIKNVKLSGLLRTLQLAEIEKVYQQYVMWYRNHITNKAQEDIFEFLVNIQADTMEQLKELFTTVELEEKEPLE